ncbi:sulfatase [Novipirellula sp. SH528]|uniref:sulfatase n=1 Tax=Novipirellula sp. SH528 TaxID=3454466 RepID=UPI003F9EDD22
MRVLNRFIAFALAAVPIGNANAANSAPAQTRPNIVFVLADDLGWRDVGFQGAKFFETPNIDKLASDGIVFNQFYSGGPNCAPTRACIMTGMYTPRHKLYTPGGKSKGNRQFMRLLVPAKGASSGDMELESRNNSISAEHTTIPEVLKTSGYTSARIGKWHLGDDTQGFDLSTCDGKDGPGHKHYGSPTVAKTMTDAAVEFIENNRDEPFFLYVAHWDVHSPIRADKDVVAKYEDKLEQWENTNGEKLNPTYAAMIEAVDTSVARIRKKLVELKLDNNTLFVFSSDNGGTGVTTMKPLRGGKGALFEGGVRVATCAAWPGVIKPGSTSDVPITSVDLLPTFTDIAGATLPKNQPVDGESFVPLLSGGSKLKRDSIFWHYPLYLQGTGDAIVKPIFGTNKGYWRGVPATVMRQGDYKLFYFYEDQSIELYNVKEDISEMVDLAEKQPERATAMKSELLAWVKETKAPTPSTLNPSFKAERDGEFQNGDKKRKQQRRP